MERGFEQRQSGPIYHVILLLCTYLCSTSLVLFPLLLLFLLLAPSLLTSLKNIGVGIPTWALYSKCCQKALRPHHLLFNLSQTYCQFLLFLFHVIFDKYEPQLHCSSQITSYSGISKTLTICKSQDVSCHSHFCLLNSGNLMKIQESIAEIVLVLCLIHSKS